MNTLESIFLESLNREGKDITINGSTQKVFFRRNDKGETDPYITMYALSESAIEQGATFILNNETYLILKEQTTENETYKKYSCIKCNQIVKIMYGANDLVEYPLYAKDINSSQLVKANVITISSKGEFILPLNEATKRITINKRFFSGFFELAWKVDDINYNNGLVYLYCERDVTNTNDDTTNGIADRWSYEDKPNSYEVLIAESSVTCDTSKTVALTVSVKENNTTMETTPTITYTVADGSICFIDSSTNTITGLAVGSTTITGSYKVNEQDTCTTDKVTVVITEPVVVENITITPAYNNSTYYGLTQYDEMTFTCTCGSNPSWTITLNANGIPSSYYTSTIDNTNGTFKVANNKMYSGANLIYTIADATSGKSTTYEIKLNGYM